jgi:plastin-1
MIGDMKEEDLIKWGNERASEQHKISNFKDKSISNCKFFFDILKSIEPRAINPELIIEGIFKLILKMIPMKLKSKMLNTYYLLPEN